MYERFIKASCKKIYELNKEKIIHYNSSNHNSNIFYENILDKNAYPNVNNLQKITKDNKLKQIFEKNIKQYIKNNIINITVSISGGVDSCGTTIETSSACNSCGFSSSVPDDTGYTAVGWLVFTISSTDYYVPAWV
jgi:predicted PP-loop superfamily ATPase